MACELEGRKGLGLSSTVVGVLPSLPLINSSSYLGVSPHRIQLGSVIYTPTGCLPSLPLLSEPARPPSASLVSHRLFLFELTPSQLPSPITSPSPPKSSSRTH